jgi:hypothetical protein
VKAFVAALAALVVVACPSAGAGPAHLRVLFVGNSLTAANDLPAMVAAIGASRHVAIDVEAYAPGGYALEDHWADGRALGELRTGHFDAVVMQQGPSSLPESGANLTEWARRWAAEARADGARPALLTVWPERERSYAFPDVIRHYRAAARSAGAASFPAGLAWKLALARGLRLYGPDGFHPSPLGTYLAALVTYAGLTGELPRTLPRAGGVAPRGAVARVLRAAASAAAR